MDNFELKFSQHHCAVLYAQDVLSTENLLYSLKNQFKNMSLEQAILVCSMELPEPWHNKVQFLEIVYLLLQKQNKMTIEKVSIENTPKLSLDKNGVEFHLDGKNITVNTDFEFYRKKKEEFNKQKSFFYPNELFVFQPVFIPKPWGQEIWYTGVEQRGVSQIMGATSQFSFPLPWFFAALPKTMLGEKQAHKNCVLIKILDPLPKEVVGDLYYELHQEKNEVYVVTEISSPVGRIKMGVNELKLKEYKNDISFFKSEFLNAIEKYEIVRRKIDAMLDSQIDFKDIPKQLQEDEVSLRKQMDEFVGYLNLQVGDVISVPILIPHALQHGVRVIEFQTPTYERLIISFAQKVLTQNHWDTKKAIDIMKMEPPKKQNLKKISETQWHLCEEVCSFPDFYAIRITLKHLKEYALKKLSFYQVLFLVKGHGELILNDVSYSILAGQCIFIPASASAAVVPQRDMTFLVCAPQGI